MAQPSQLDSFNKAMENKMPGAINVLTILTFIGCGLQLIMSFFSKSMMNYTIKMMDDPSRFEQLTTAQKDNLASLKQTAALYDQYFIPLTVITMVGITLCFIGAMQMRKLKKEGFYMYVAGEFIPIVASAILIGISVQFSSVFTIIIGLGVPILFTILYSRQLKYMK